MSLKTESIDILLLGSGGREHAILRMLSKSQRADKLWVAPGNGGMYDLAQKAEIDQNNPVEVADFAQKHNIGLVVIGPEAPLVKGVGDEVRKRGIAVFGPNKKAAYMEGSKKFAKEIMSKANIPTAEYETFTDMDKAIEFVEELSRPVVVKADGLAAGKGVFVANTTQEAIEGIKKCFSGEFGESGYEVVIEEMLYGPECSMLVLTDGRNVVPLAISQDHKRALEGDMGPNTGGMGVYSPVPIVSDDEYKIMLDCMQRAVDTLSEMGIDYSGCLYGGFMLTEDGPKILEFNARFGDPETQVILPRMKADLVDVLLACDNQTLSQDMIDWDDKWAVCVVLTSKGYPGSYEKGKAITGISEAEKLNNVTIYQAGTALDENGVLVTSGGRVINVVAMGKTFEEARNLCYQACELIDFDGKTYRRDIGLRALQAREK